MLSKQYVFNKTIKLILLLFYYLSTVIIIFFPNITVTL